ncbi:unnamed protein product, partial [Mesorhabditis spiculigera]
MLVVVVSLAVFGATLAINPNLQCAPGGSVGPCNATWPCATPSTVCLPIGGGDFGCCMQNQTVPVCPGCKAGQSTGNGSPGQLVCCPSDKLASPNFNVHCAAGKTNGPCGSGNSCTIPNSLCVPTEYGDGCCAGDDIVADCTLTEPYCPYSAELGPCIPGLGCQSGAQCVNSIFSGQACCPNGSVITP